MRKAKPPAGLGTEATSLWRRVYAACEWDEPALLLLDELAKTYDRLEQAREQIQQEGLTVVETTAAGKDHIRPHQSLRLERDCQTTLNRIWRSLGFDQEAPK